MSERKSDVNAVVQDVSNLATGIMGKLFGPRVSGRASEGDHPVVSPAVDDAVERVGDALGKVLSAVGEGLEQHPTDPTKAVHTIGGALRDPTPAPRDEGFTRLATGLAHFAEGVGAVAEHVVEAAKGKPR